ncbi:hypothetical protein G9A89_020288 [Geosiphon pyriformis]|nr:hypothetical protein G9A89_020288 [Geosiphon pyriformis]
MPEILKQLNLKPTTSKLTIPTLITLLFNDTADLSNPNDTAIILTFSILVSSINLLTDNICNLSTIAATSNLLNTSNLNPKLSSYNIKKSQLLKPAIKIMPVEFRNQIYPKPEFSKLFKSIESNQKQPLISNIFLTTVINNKLLTAIFLFKLEKLTSMPLFSRAVFKEKPITTMYTNAKVDGHFIKLILNSRLADINHTANTRIITANRATKTPIGKINNFLFEVNGIIIPIKILVMEATQYQALVGNNWLYKTNAMLNWNTQELHKNNFKVATTPDATTLEYYQSIYTHCKQRFNIPDGIEVVKKSVYQYIENHINNYLFRNYNILKVRSNLYNNLAHYSQLGTEDLNSKTLATYFHELNFNIIKYCEETYPVQSQYTIDFELETETSNKDKNKLKQYLRTTPNTPTLPKTTAIHLQTPEQGTKDFTSLRSSTRQQEFLQTSPNLLEFIAENQSKHSETATNEENDPKTSKEESIVNENEEDEMTTYITKISEFNGEDIETSPQE